MVRFSTLGALCREHWSPSQEQGPASATGSLLRQLKEAFGDGVGRADRGVEHFPEHQRPVEPVRGGRGGGDRDQPRILFDQPGDAGQEMGARVPDRAGGDHGEKIGLQIERFVLVLRRSWQTN